jgi:hypothetical protein
MKTEWKQLIKTAALPFKMPWIFENAPGGVDAPVPAATSAKGTGGKQPIRGVASQARPSSAEPRRHDSQAQRAGFLKAQRVRAENPAQKAPVFPCRRAGCHAVVPLALMIFCIRFPWAAPKAVMPPRRWRSAGNTGIP